MAVCFYSLDFSIKCTTIYVQEERVWAFYRSGGIYPCVFIKNNKIPWGVAHGHGFTANKFLLLFVMNLVAVLI